MALQQTRSRVDLRPYKVISRSNVLEAVLRVSVLNFSAGFAAFIFADSAFIVMALVYNIFQFAFLAALHKGADRVSKAYGLMVYALGSLVIATIMLAAGYCWFVHAETGRVLGLLLIIGAMLNSICLRAGEPIASRVEESTIAVTLVILLAGTLVLEGMSNSAIAQSAGLGGCLGYYLLAQFKARKTNEALASAQNKEVQRARMEAIGQIAGGVAHDFNNLLTVIRGNMELRREVLANGGAPEDAEEMLREAESAAERATQTTQQLLSFSRRASLDAVHVDVAELVARLIPLMKRTLPATVSLVLRNPDPVPKVMIDSTGLENVILNLVINARDAMPNGGQITLCLFEHTNEQDVQCVALEVRDTGSGMPQEIQARVVEPYFTTKAVGEGSGLGLAMAKGFAEQSNGLLSIDSALGRGTTVRLDLPAAPKSAAETRQRSKAAS